MIIDIIILIIVVISFIIGIVRGFVKELSTLLGLILGIYLASQKYPLLEKYVAGVFPNATASKVISFIIIFLVVFFVTILLGVLLQKVIKLIMLGWLDKILGGIFGIVKGVLIVWLLLVLAIELFPKTENYIKKSNLGIKILTAGSKYTKFPEYLKKTKESPKKYTLLITRTTNSSESIITKSIIGDCHAQNGLAMTDG